MRRGAAPFALAVIAAYMAARWAIYRAMPVHDTHSWVIRDTVMSLPRLAAFAACLVFCRRRGGWSSWGWSAALTRSGAAALGLGAVITVLTTFSNGSRCGMPAGIVALGWLTTGPVALFEETAFRSILYLGLRERLSPLRAAALASLAFALFHIQAEPSVIWPQIFVFSLAACAALERRTGLAWLVAVHWLVDGHWFLASAPPPLPWAGPACAAAMLAATALSAALLRRPAVAIPVAPVKMTA